MHYYVSDKVGIKNSIHDSFRLYIKSNHDTKPLVHLLDDVKTQPAIQTVPETVKNNDYLYTSHHTQITNLLLYASI